MTTPIKEEYYVTLTKEEYDSLKYNADMMVAYMTDLKHNADMLVEHMSNEATNRNKLK